MTILQEGASGCVWEVWPADKGKVEDIDSAFEDSVA